MELAEKILNRINISKFQKKFLITLFTTIFDLDLECIKKFPKYQYLINYGNIAA